MALFRRYYGATTSQLSNPHVDSVIESTPPLCRGVGLLPLCRAGVVTAKRTVPAWRWGIARRAMDGAPAVRVLLSKTANRRSTVRKPDLH